VTTNYGSKKRVIEQATKVGVKHLRAVFTWQTKTATFRSLVRFQIWILAGSNNRDILKALIHRTQISIGLSVFRFVANEYKRIAIWLHSTTCNIRSAIWWAITKVILNYSPLPSFKHGATSSAGRVFENERITKIPRICSPVPANFREKSGKRKLGL
jgi:hypothetical protein